MSAVASLRAEDPYSGFASIYDDAMGDAAFPTVWRAFERAVRRHEIRFRSAADVGCGTGRFLERLSRTGARLFGVDRSQAMLQRAQQRLHGRAVQLFKQDMRALRLPQHVDLVTCNFCTLNYTRDEADLKRVLGACRGNLVAGGWLVADLLLDIGPLAQREIATQKLALPGVRSLWRVALDPRGRGSVVRMRTVMRRRGATPEVWRETHTQRWYRLADVLRLMRGANLRTLDVSRMEGAGAVTRDCRWVQVVARAS